MILMMFLQEWNKKSKIVRNNDYLEDEIMKYIVLIGSMISTIAFSMNTYEIRKPGPKGISQRLCLVKTKKTPQEKAVKLRNKYNDSIISDSDIEIVSTGSKSIDDIVREKLPARQTRKNLFENFDETN